MRPLISPPGEKILPGFPFEAVFYKNNRSFCSLPSMKSSHGTSLSHAQGRLGGQPAGEDEEYRPKIAQAREGGP